MSIRIDLLNAIKASPGITTDELYSALPALTSRQVLDNVHCALGEGLLKRERDDITGRAAYRLTEKGQQRIHQGPKKQIVKRTPAGGGKKSPAVKHRYSRVAGGLELADLPAEGMTVVEPPKPVQEPAAAGSNATPGYNPDEVCFNPVKRAATLRDRADLLQDQLDQMLVERLNFLNWVSELIGGAEKPLNLAECQNIITSLIDSASEMITDRDARIASLEVNQRLDLIPQPGTADMVEHPPHYHGKVECIDAIESALGPAGFVAYCRGNAMKYTFRAGKKGDFQQDLEKAQWYLRRAAA